MIANEANNCKANALLLAFVLVVAHHTVPHWLMRGIFRVPAGEVYRNYGSNVYANLWDVASLLLPLLLCVGSPRHYGLQIGDWTTHRWKMLGVTLGPVLAVIACYRFTSQPFVGDRIGCWLISPAAQDLLFTGYLYTLLVSVFRGPAASGVAIGKATFIAAILFSIWHIPNFMGMSASFVTFQLFYTFLFGLCILSAREWTGSIIPGLLSHMACNFFSWIKW